MSGWLLSSTVLVGVVLVLRRLLRRHLHPTVIYALWLLAAIRLLVPVQIGVSDISLDRAASSLPLVRQADALLPTGTTDDALSPAVLDSHPTQDSTPAESDTTTAAVSWPKVIIAVWIGGSAVTLGWFLTVNGRCYVRLRRSRRPLDAGGDLPVYVSAAIDTPCLFGRSIYVTPEVAADETALRHVLAHEATHYRHGDPLWALVRGACLAVHWWNPLVWLAAIRSREDSELACDACAVKQLGGEERTAYGRTLIALSCGKTTPSSVLAAATTMSGGKRTLKERVCLLAKQPRTRAVAAFVLAAAVILAAVAGFTGGKSGSFTLRAQWVDEQTVRLSVSGDDGLMVMLYRTRYHDGEAVASTKPIFLTLPNQNLDITLLDEGPMTDNADFLTTTWTAQSNESVRFPTTDWAQADPQLGYVWSVMEGTLHMKPGSMYPIAWCGFSGDGNIDALPVKQLSENPYQMQSQKGDYFVVWMLFPYADGHVQTSGDPGMYPDIGTGEADALLNKLAEQQAALFRIGNWYTQALTSTYDDPRDVDLYWMFYNGGSRQPTQEEYDYVQQQLGGPSTDVMVISRQEMDEALTEVFGLTLEETRKNNLDQFIYRADTDCYYLCHGDTNAMAVEFLSTNTPGDDRTAFTYEGWDGTYTVTMRGSHIESNVKQ